jgi:5-methylcytosine-specific restriction endonuclease McrA
VELDRGGPETVTWFKIDDSFHSHPKALQAGNVALGVWVRCGSYCAQHLTDGHVPTEVGGMYGSTHATRRLIQVGLWEPHPQGWVMHDYLDYNPSRSEVLSDRQYNVRKASLHRDPNLVAAVRARDGSHCRYCRVAVNWKDRRGATGGTYDHVDPAGPNSFENLVVACRGCNSRKGTRTPEEAGMNLVPI